MKLHSLIKYKHLAGYALVILLSVSVTLYMGWDYFLLTHQLDLEAQANASLLTLSYLLEEDHEKARNIQMLELEGALIELKALEMQAGELLIYDHYLEQIARLDSLYPGQFPDSLLQTRGF